MRRSIFPVLFSVSGELICSADVDLMRYHGNVSATNSGNDRWEWKVFQNVPDYHFDVDGSKMLAKSYCRNIQVQPNTLPWCLSKLTNQIEYCHEQICKGIFKFKISTFFFISALYVMFPLFPGNQKYVP